MFCGFTAAIQYLLHIIGLSIRLIILRIFGDGLEQGRKHQTNLIYNNIHFKNIHSSFN